MCIQISVIIPSYNSSKTLVHALEGIINQEKIDGYEVIVVDSSDDGNMESIISQYGSLKIIKFIRSEKRLSPSEGRNLGVSQSSGTLLVFIDSDVVPSPIFLNKIKKAYESGYLTGGGGIEVPDFQRCKSIALAQYYLQFNEFLPVGVNRVKMFVPSCNLFCERGVFLKAGGFPDIRASEDVILGKNIGRFEKVWFVPEITVSHIFRENWKSFFANQKLLGKYVAIYRKKESGSFSQKGLFPFIFAPLFFIIKCCRIIPRIINAGPLHIFRFIRSLPLFLIGLSYWTTGFVQGSLNKESHDL
ncbi:MAG: glycosyltransferase [Desulfatiglans sp.]|jgi:glycosyltransferase involved in cell wall biosynthesis|nr:glycosyltransferase [Desulfatiglans sp.]